MPTDEPRVELFRPAAVAAHRAGSGDTATLASSHRVTSLAYWIMLGVVVAIIAAAFTVHVEETSGGVWAAGPRPGYATVALPIGSLDRLQVGDRVGMRGTGGASVVDAAIDAVLNPQPLAVATAQMGPLPSSLRNGAAVAMVEVALPAGVTGRGRATAHLGRRSLAAELVPGLRHETRGGG